MRSIACLLLLSCFAVAEDDKVPFEEKVKNSKPLKLTVDVFKEGDAVLKISLLLPEKPFLTDRFSDGPRSLRVDGDKLQAWFTSQTDGDKVHGFKLPKVNVKLVYDEAFGDKGIAPFERKKGDWKPREDFGDWGGDVKTRPLGEHVGHHVSEKDHWLEVKTKDGKEVATLGKIDGKSDICWLQNFCRYKDLVFLVDSNCRKIGVWTIEGKHLFNISCSELGLNYPWVQSIDITEDGTMYLGFTQERNNLEDQRDSGVTEAAFIRITGLDTIDPPAHLALIEKAAAEETEKAAQEEIARAKRFETSVPLAIEERVVKKGDAILQVTPLLMEKPYLTEYFSEGPRSLKVEKDGLHVIFKAEDEASHHLFQLPAKGGKLAHDETFGENGIKPFDEEKPDWERPEQYNWMNKMESRALGADLVGHAVRGDEQHLIVKTKEGKELATLGLIDGKSDICWLKNWCRHKELVFIIDGNCRKICVWTLKGQKLFDIKCDELGLDYPWVTSIDITADGAMYLGFTQERKNHEGKDSDVTESGFLKITGLDTIKVPK